jgi:formamidopyrimidine-DNA glycosylase
VPELPDIELYLGALRSRILGERLERIRLASPFLLRSIDPPLSKLHGRTVVGLRRLGKRIVFELSGGYFLVLHLMIAGRLRWKPKGTAIARKVGLAAFDFSNGVLLLTEAGSKRRASLHAARGERALKALDPGGIDVFTCALEEFRQRITAENHTVKRVLCDPKNFSGIGNAYSDEILHAARLSPFKLTHKLEPAEIESLLEKTRQVLKLWIERLREQAGSGFPEKVTAFRPEMAVHGKFREPCPVCGAPIQRVVYADNETNYCAVCQTGGKVLKDRALSRLLRDDWPRSIDEMDWMPSSQTGAPGTRRTRPG